MKENLQVIGMFVSSTVFQETVFQSQLCSAGSLKDGCLFQVATIYSTLSVALERLPLERFFRETRFLLPCELEEIYIDAESYSESVLPVCKDLTVEYESFKESIRKGYVGYTAQYWMIYLMKQ